MRDPHISQSPVITDPGTTDPHPHRRDIPDHHHQDASSNLLLSTSAAGVIPERLLLSKCLLIGSTLSICILVSKHTHGNKGLVDVKRTYIAWNDEMPPSY